MVINKYGETLINLSDIYDVDLGISDGVVPVKNGSGKWGLLDINENKLVTDFMYDSIKSREFGFIVEMNGNYGLYHVQSSTLLIPCRYKKYLQVVEQLLSNVLMVIGVYITMNKKTVHKESIKIFIK